MSINFTEIFKHLVAKIGRMRRVALETHSTHCKIVKAGQLEIYFAPRPL